MQTNWTVLAEVLSWLATIGAGVFAYWVVNRVNWDAVAEQAPMLTAGDLAIWKRLTAWIVAALVAWLAWLIAMAMLYMAEPVGWRAWVESLFGVAAVAITTSQGVHTVRDLPNKRACC